MCIRDSISIKNSNFTNISHTAIRFKGVRENQFKNLEIFDNIVLRTGGPGMVFNSTRNLFAKRNDINFSGSFDDTRKWGRGSGLWTWGSSYAVISQNKFQNANGPADSAGCHIDFNCNDIIVENNLSQNNAGGFIEILGNNYNCSYRYNTSINDGYRVKGKDGAFQEGKTFWLSGYAGNGKDRNGPFNSYIYGNKVYVGKDIIPKIAVDKAASGVFVANNIFYFENDPVMVLGDQYKPDAGGGSEIKNVFFENNVFRTNHWPNNVLIQPDKNILMTENEMKENYCWDEIDRKRGRAKIAQCYDTEMSEVVKHVKWGKKDIYNTGLKELKPQTRVFIDYINGDSKGLWQGF